MKLINKKRLMGELARRSFIDYIAFMWQRTDKFIIGRHTEIVCEAFDTAIQDFKNGKSTFMMIKVCVRHGKNLAHDTAIVTPDGIVRHGDLCIGNYVYGRNGKPVRITNISNTEYVDNMITFSDGSKIVCHDNHEWLVYDCQLGKERIIETKNIYNTYLCNDGIRRRYLVDGNVLIEFDSKHLPIHPYVLGVWLGDGSSAKNCINIARCDYAIAEKIELLGYKITGESVHKDTGVLSIYFRRLYKELIENKLMNNKHIPNDYLFNSKENRLELLAGLIDTDGYLNKKDGRVCFSNTNKIIIDSVKFLINSLGQRTTICKYQAKVSSSGICGKKDVYQLLFLPPKDIPNVIQRKKPIYHSQSKRRSIVKIEKISSVPGKCIEVEGGTYLAGDKMILTHNSDMSSRYFPSYFIGKFPDLEVIVAGYAYSLASGFSRDCRCIVSDPRYRYVFPGVYLARKQRGLASWGIEGRLGQTHWLGIGGAATGKGGSCFPAGTMIETNNGSVDIAHLCQLYLDYKVLSYNNGKLEYRSIIATNKRISESIVNIRTAVGRSVICTEDHLFYVDGEYIPAKELKNGQNITVCDFEVRLLRKNILETFIRGKESFGEKVCSQLLLEEMFKCSSCCEKCKLLYKMWKAKTREKAFEVLLRFVQKKSFQGIKCNKNTEENKEMFVLWNKLCAKNYISNLLFQEVSKCSTFKTDDREKEFKLQKQGKFDEIIYRDETINHTERFLLCDMRKGRYQVQNCKEDILRYSPHRQKYKKQFAGKSCFIMQEMSYSFAQVVKEPISMVERICNRKIEVYDIEVEKTHNFFANKILVHNCIIIDDIFKNRLQAESEIYRNRVWDSFTNDIMTRRAPVSIVAVVGTPWNIDDHYGRIEKYQKENPEFPCFKEIKLPAFDKKYTGGILFPERFALDWYLSQRALLGPYGSAGLLQCEPVARGGNIFEVDKIKEYDVAPEGLIWCRGWDLASTEKQRISEDPDYTVGSLIGVRWIPLTETLFSAEIYLEDVIEGRWAAPKRKEIILAATAKDGSKTQVSIEGFGPYKDAYEEMKIILNGVRKLHKSQLPGDKVTKASPIEIIISAGNFYIKKNAPWKNRVLDQLRVFSGKSTQHDDIVDSIVVAYDGVNPHLKRVWPQFDNRHIKKLNINWNIVITDKNSALHYAGIYQKKDLSVWIVMAIWDSYKGFLFIYDAFMCGDPIPSNVVPRIIDKMMLRKLSCEAIITNSLMWEDQGYTKNIALQYKKQFQKNKINVKIKEAFNYDEYATLVEIGQLFDNNMIYVDDSVNCFILQAMTWSLTNMGKQTGDRPDEEDDGYCRALCLIDSELRRLTRWQDVMKPVLMDYSKRTLVQNIYDKANKISIAKKITDEEYISGDIYGRKV